MASLKGNFNGARLKAARLYNAMTIADVAEATGISNQAISQYENGKIEPKLDVILKLIGILGFPRKYFFEEDDKSIIVGDTYFRSMSSTTKKDRMAQIERLKLIARIYEIINKYIAFPTFKLKGFENISLINLDVEKIADSVREQWSLGNQPIYNIIDILEKNGIIVSSVLTNGSNIDAYSQVTLINKRQIPIIVLGSDKESAFRRQFSAAHELGHIIMDDLYDLDSLSKLEYREMENVMHRFAGALLVPKQELINDLNIRCKSELRLYVELKKKYRVSASALIVRANQIGAITTNQYQYLMKQLSTKGYRTIEPYDEETPVAEPRYLKYGVEMIINKKIMTKQEFMNELSCNRLTLNSSMVEELMNLQEGYLKFENREDPICIGVK